jgi:two-component system sensor histidine kinase TctE
VTVRCGKEGGAFLAVEDSGVGIPEGERDRVFERFYRGAAATGDGCGLGLAIVKEAAERHDARISISSPLNGPGTIVCIRFGERVEPVGSPSDARTDTPPAFGDAAAVCGTAKVH